MKLFSTIPCLYVLLGSSALNVPASRTNTSIQETSKNYYYNQLVTEDSKKIYNALSQILAEDKFKTGDYTIDLVSNGYLENKEYNQNKLMSDFVAAKDCFRFDNPEVFYVDFSKISIRQTQNGSNYIINLGIGREDNYFYEGFNKNNIDNIISETSKKIDEIVALATSKNTPREKINTVYQQIMVSSSYALETTAKPENRYYVRSAYGALVKGEALCEGFASTTKIILDQLGFTSTLIQGMFNYENRTELHMWNYIQMEDSRWYLLDTTMDNGLKEDGTSREYFLKSGKDLVSTEYIPEGTVSVSSSSSLFELKYPTLSSIPYKENANYFTFTKENNKTFASYLGMGIQEAMNKGKYIIYTYDVDTMKTGWTYYAQSHAAMQVMAGYTPKLTDIDSNGKFDISLIGDVSAVFAVTHVKPKYTFEEIVSQKKISPNDYTYTGSLDDIYHYSNVNGSTPVAKGNPHVVEKSHSGISLEQNKTYTVSVKYNENLKKVYQNEPVQVIGSNLLGEVNVSNINRNENEPNKISFTFSTTKSFYRNLNYYFELDNLIGEKSKLKPLEICYNVVNNVEFACPKVEGAINTVYTNKPALIDDGDISTTGWKDQNGKDISKDLPFRLALVAKKHDTSISEEMTNKIKQTGEKVLKSSTFELNLQLCDAQIAFLNGNKLKVLMPFPEGYGPQDQGITFKAYHFKKDGTPEEIESVITEHGLIMYVNAFSPFAIVVTKGERVSRKLSIQINGQATVENSYIELNKDQEKTVSINLKGNSSIDFVSLNNKVINVTDNKVTISYDQLNKIGNLLEINTLVNNVLNKELEEGYHSIEKYTPSTPSTPVTPKPEENNDADLIKIISISVSVALVVLGGIVCFISYRKSKRSNKTR